MIRKGHTENRVLLATAFSRRISEKAWQVEHREPARDETGRAADRAVDGASSSGMPGRPAGNAAA